MKYGQLATLSIPLNTHYPSWLRENLQEWNNMTLPGFPPVVTWRTVAQSPSQIVQSGGNPESSSEAFIGSLIRAHTARVATLNGSKAGLMMSHQIRSLKHCIYSAAR